MSDSEDEPHWLVDELQTMLRSCRENGESSMTRKLLDNFLLSPEAQRLLLVELAVMMLHGPEAKDSLLRSQMATAAAEASQFESMGKPTGTKTTTTMKSRHKTRFGEKNQDVMITKSSPVTTAILSAQNPHRHFAKNSPYDYAESDMVSSRHSREESEDDEEILEVHETNTNIRQPRLLTEEYENEDSYTESTAPKMESDLSSEEETEETKKETQINSIFNDVETKHIIPPLPSEWEKRVFDVMDDLLSYGNTSDDEDEEEHIVEAHHLSNIVKNVITVFPKYCQPCVAVIERAVDEFYGQPICNTVCDRMANALITVLSSQRVELGLLDEDEDEGLPDSNRHLAYQLDLESKFDAWMPPSPTNEEQHAVKKNLKLSTPNVSPRATLANSTPIRTRNGTPVTPSSARAKRISYDTLPANTPAWKIPNSPLDDLFRQGYGGLGQDELEEVIRIADDNFFEEDEEEEGHSHTDTTENVVCSNTNNNGLGVITYEGSEDQEDEQGRHVAITSSPSNTSPSRHWDDEEDIDIDEDIEVTVDDLPNDFGVPAASRLGELSGTDRAVSPEEYYSASRDAIHQAVLRAEIAQSAQQAFRRPQTATQSKPVPKSKKSTSKKSDSILDSTAAAMAAAGQTHSAVFGYDYDEGTVGTSVDSTVYRARLRKASSAAANRMNAISNAKPMSHIIVPSPTRVRPLSPSVQRISAQLDNAISRSKRTNSSLDFDSQPRRAASPKVGSTRSSMQRRTGGTVDVPASLTRSSSSGRFVTGSGANSTLNNGRPASAPRGGVRRVSTSSSGAFTGTTLSSSTSDLHHGVSSSTKKKTSRRTPRLAANSRLLEPTSATRHRQDTKTTVPTQSPRPLSAKKRL